MKALCIKDTGEFKAGIVYNSCPVLCGYQISSDTERTFREADIKSVHVFLDSNYAEHFRTVR